VKAKGCEAAGLAALDEEQVSRLAVLVLDASSAADSIDRRLSAFRALAPPGDPTATPAGKADRRGEEEGPQPVVP
jgi:hypothetical protein